MIVRTTDFDEAIADQLVTRLRKRFDRIGLSDQFLNIDPSAHDSWRQQYSTKPLLDELESFKMDENDFILGLTSVDLFVPGLNYVFGQARVGKGVAIISSKRLDPSFLGSSKDNSLFIERMEKEAVHEIGHLLGLPHCSIERCVMFFSNCLDDTDRKRSDFCSSCQMKL
ncbi:MAG: archaemetzincin family Zn-dependent metalloprotease [Thermoplasmatota archaeon]